jgi:hypothetical protein
VVVIHSFKRYLLEDLSSLLLVALHSLCGVGIMRVISAVRKYVEVVLSVLLMYAPLTVGLSSCQSSYVINCCVCRYYT